MEEDEIEERVSALRSALMGQLDSQRVDARGLKSHQVHELAQAKMGTYHHPSPSPTTYNSPY